VRANKKGMHGHALVTANLPLNKTALPSTCQTIQQNRVWFTAPGLSQSLPPGFRHEQQSFFTRLWGARLLFALVSEGRKESVTDSGGIR